MFRISRFCSMAFCSEGCLRYSLLTSHEGKGTKRERGGMDEKRGWLERERKEREPIEGEVKK